MKLIDRAKSALGALGVIDVEKRPNGVFVSRPILNAKIWADWAIRHNLPNPVPADQMHVTVIYSTVDVKMVPDPLPKSVSTLDGNYPGLFAKFGPDENVLVFAFDHWELHDRHYFFTRNGAVSKWPTYRPHLTLSYDMGDFELPDEALADAPREIIMGGEVFADIKSTDKAPADDADPEGDGENPDLIIIIEIARSAAKKLLESEQTLSVVDRMALRDIVAQETVSKNVAERLAKSPWATDELKALFAAPAVAKGVQKSKDVTIGFRPMTQEIAKKLGGTYVKKSSDEERMLIGIANMMTVKSQLVVDFDGDTFTTQAVTEWMRDIIRTHRGVDFDHEGPACMELVQGFVLSEDIQKALGIVDLGFEPALVEVHVPDLNHWAQVKDDPELMFSIAGTFYYKE